MRSCVMILTPALISVNLLDVVLDGGIVLYLIFNDVGVRFLQQAIYYRVIQRRLINQPG